MGDLLRTVQSEVRLQTSKSWTSSLSAGECERLVGQICTGWPLADAESDTATNEALKTIRNGKEARVVEGNVKSAEALANAACTSEVGPWWSTEENEDVEVVGPVAKLEFAGVQLLVPDEEASAVVAADAKGGGGKRRRLLGSYSGQLWKLKMNWIKNWKKQWVIVDAHGFAYAKQTTARDQSMIPFDKILTAVPAAQEDVGPKLRLKPDCFMIKTKDERMHLFAPEPGPMTGAKWCKAIVSHALVHAMQNHMSLERVAHFCELGADVNAALPDGRQYPPLALALVNKSTEIARYLLRRGADPSCILRWSFLMVDNVTSPVNILQLLIDTKKDLNVCSDDAHGWTLLHYLAYEGDLDSVTRLIARVDVPTIRAVNTLGDCSLMLALKRHTHNPPDSVQRMCLALAKNCDVHRRDKMNDTVLHLAIRRGHLELSKKLINYGAKVDERDSAGDTALHIAVKTQQFDLARWIVENLEKERRKSILDMQDEKRGDTVFAVALKLCQEELCLFFLQHGADCSITSRQWDLSPSCERDSPLQVAIKMRMTKLSESIVSNFCTINELLKVDTGGTPPVILALNRNMMSLVLVMIKVSKRLQQSVGDSHSPLDVPSQMEGNTALHVAVGRGYLILASTMVDFGANPNIQNGKGQAVLHLCIELIRNRGGEVCPQFAQIVLRFMEGLITTVKAMDPTLRCGELGYTPLHLAVLGALIGPASLLLKFRSALANDYDERGNSSLSLAIKQGNEEIVELLISHGANVNVVNADSLCPLHLAVQVENCAIATTLLKNNAYPGVWDLKGWCPIHRATAQNLSDLVEVLAKYCSRPRHLDLRTEDGHTALMLGVKFGCVDSVRVLLSHGVDMRARTPTLRMTVFHIAAEICLSKKKGFIESGVAQCLVELSQEAQSFDLDKKGTSSADALLAIKECISLPGRSSPVIQSNKTVAEVTAPTRLVKETSSCSPPQPPDVILAAFTQHVTSDETERPLQSNPAKNSHSLPKLEEEETSRPTEIKVDKVDGTSRRDPIERMESGQHSDSDNSNKSSRSILSSIEKDQQSQKVEHGEIIEVVKDEGRKVALEWLRTSQGQHLILKRAAKLQQAQPELSSVEAKQDAVETFIAEHLAVWFARLKIIT